MTFGGLALLIAVALFLIQRFDSEASKRESRMVEHGFSRQLNELNDIVSTQVSWDDAVKALDHNRDRKWADFNIGSYLFTFNGFSRAFVVDSEGKVFYASVKGERAGLEHFNKFAPIAAQLVPKVRELERARPPLRQRPGKNNVVVPPIVSHGMAEVDGEIYYVVAALVQPDFGLVLPRTARAPVAILAKPVDKSMLGSFSGRYMLDGLRLEKTVIEAADVAYLPLKSPDGQIVAALAWTSQQPGTHLARKLALPFLVGIVLLGLVAWVVVRRGSGVVRELVASEARAKHLAYHDTLTRLPNRAKLFEHLGKQLARVGQDLDHLAILCVDLDRFKEVNDTLGHHAGDHLIEVVANRLRETCDRASLIARLGGDEFVVVLEVSGQPEAQAVADAIIACVGGAIDSEFGRMEIGCSIGIAVVDQPGIDPSEALRWADLALYQAKEQGRMCASLFMPELDLAVRNRRSLEADLRQAINRGLLTMVYQPQVDRRGEFIAVEALVRWHHPERGDVPPGVFVPVAEECGLIGPMGEAVLRTVFAETASWHKVRVAINLSAVQLRAPGFAALVMRLAAKAGVDPSRYEFELTETALLDDDLSTASNIEALKRMGFSIALDDFGSGYSSLSLLQRFSVDKIKIDRSFVSTLGGQGESEALVDAMVKLARALNLSVIAEGVETEVQKNRLVACGCREFQGHLTGRPVVADEIAELIGLPAQPDLKPVRRRA